VVGIIATISVQIIFRIYISLAVFSILSVQSTYRRVRFNSNIRFPAPFDTPLIAFRATQDATPEQLQKQINILKFAQDAF